ncbi:MAG: aminotransferase class I/II-fold pyridoxal phosphate-dependent enzyme, partial [Streptomyces sp.]
RTAAARAHGVLGAALHAAFTEAGALCRPPRVGRHLYADLEPVRPRLAAHGIEDAAGLEAELVRRFGPYASGGHRFGDDPHALRVRLSCDLLTGGGFGARAPAAPLEALGVGRALDSVRSAVTELTTATSRE